ncbi:phosphotyrosine protein phosphatase [Pandoraea terrae]|uniref:protein-tyrosine-phosphatase n=1 Tax=Pandoraea terrae TaxID=1537710 RepID=A0A5E4UU70_9BURK|nr:low molecular weight protein-tyrosine-phosphatase [Pandoraea terrae]VVE02589.1 phosphotyrosine protein phosphatase [Pandoraea terrae]
MPTILILCTGNICRSPMAEALLRAKVPGLRILSAGLNAAVGMPADPHVIRLMRERGFDVGAHRGRQLQGWMIQAADLILVMERQQRLAVEALFPICRGKVLLWGEFDGRDVPDPYLQDEMAFRQVLGMISDGLTRWAERLPRLLGPLSCERSL